jgi:hypothetical protein
LKKEEPIPLNHKTDVSTTACDECGWESRRKEIFHIGPPLFGLKIKTLCPICFANKHSKAYLALLLGYVILLIAALLVGQFFPSLSLSVWLFNLTWLELFVFVSTIIHELGHALAGRIVRFRIFVIEIGQGGVVSAFNFAGFRWQFRSIPFGGCVHVVPRNTKCYKLRKTLCVLSGPLANAVLIAACLSIWPDGTPIQSGAFKDSDPALMFVLGNASLLIYSLWPFRFESGPEDSPNDILLFWQTLCRPQAEIDQIPAYWYFKESQECQRNHKYEEARKWIREGLKRFPKNYYLEFAEAYNFMDLKKYQEGRKAYVKLLGRYSKSEELRFTIFNNIADGNLLSGDSQLLEEAEICSRVAVEKYPYNHYFAGTRGSVLIGLGQYEEGLKILPQALKAHSEPSLQASLACYIGFAEARLGRLDESQNFFTMARRFDPNCVLLERLNTEKKAA